MNDYEWQELQRQLEARRPSLWKDFREDPTGIILLAVLIVVTVSIFVEAIIK